MGGRTPPGAGVFSSTYVGISGAVNHSSRLDRDGETYAHSGKGIISKGGVLLSHAHVTLIGIPDGTSNVIMVGEQSDQCIDVNGARKDCRSDFGHCFTMGPGGAGENRHWNLTTVRYRINDKTWENRGVGEVYYGQNRPLLSPHTGGAMMLFGDAGVRFVADTLSVQSLYSLCNRDDGNPAENY